MIEASVALERLLALPVDGTELWIQPAVRKKVAELLPFRVGTPPEAVVGTDRLVVVGGGTLLDIAKAWRVDRSPSTRLVAVPSLWGSGAEVSPIVVLNEGTKKSIRMDDRFLPDEVVYWPELAESLPNDLAEAACGDCWAHALEGFLSPLADTPLREEITDLLHRMAGLPLGNDSSWFELGAEACAAQARSSVGLVHGIAHTVEGPIRAAAPDRALAHAKLCSVFLWPVMTFNCAADSKGQRLLAEHGVDVGAVLEITRKLHDSSAYERALPVLKEHWRDVLRDQCTRTNVRLVRPTDLDFFIEWSPA